MTILDRFWSKVDDSAGPDACWEWTACRTKDGYGQFGLTQATRLAAHRFAYELLVGSIPDGLQIDHLCRNRGCVNPRHMEAVTLKENVLRGTGPTATNARKTHCKHGHEFTTENTRLVPEGRICRRCDVAKTQRYRALKKVAA